MILDTQSLLQGFEKLLLDYSTKETSYSPFYSNIGLAFAEQCSGIGEFWLHYNRCSRVLWKQTARFDAYYNAELSTPMKIVFIGDTVKAGLSFFDTDSFLLEITGQKEVVLFEKNGEGLGEYWTNKINSTTVLLQGYTLNGDARDPDDSAGILLGVKCNKGTLHCRKNKITVSSDENGTVSVGVSFEVLETDTERMLKRLKKASYNMAEVQMLWQNEIAMLTEELHLNCTEQDALLLTKAANGLLSNIVKAPGKLKKYPSAYPSRGYNSHYLWDTCFQNLAYEKFSLKLAKAFLLQLAACQRPDGKYEQFLCATWGRPGYTQPALVGWAALREAKLQHDMPFMKTMLKSIEDNNRWWLSNRMTAYGVIACPHGLETGQDNSPRFDNGITLPCDMNSYLYNQMLAAKELSMITGQRSKAVFWQKKADILREAMLKNLYDEKDNLFYDVNIQTGEKVKIVSPSSLLPLWAGVSPGQEKAKAMIERYLLNPKKMFGKVPFPSIAYDEKCYESDNWWRGPTWMPIAYLMLETLEKYGYSEQKKSAEQRLHDVIAADGKMHELFNSKTGQGEGEEEQGWTCAVFFALM